MPSRSSLERRASCFSACRFSCSVSFAPALSSSRLRETTSSHSTFTWRTTGWSELIASHHSLADFATGGPAGASWARQIAGSTVRAAPHDAYVEAFLRFGLPGLTVFLGLWVVVWRSRADVARQVGLTSTAIVLLLASQAIYGIAYPLGEIQGFIFGIFIAGLTLAHGDRVATLGARCRFEATGARPPTHGPSAGVWSGTTDDESPLDDRRGSRRACGGRDRMSRRKRENGALLGTFSAQEVPARTTLVAVVVDDRPPTNATDGSGLPRHSRR